MTEKWAVELVKYNFNCYRFLVLFEIVLNFLPPTFAKRLIDSHIQVVFKDIIIINLDQ